MQRGTAVGTLSFYTDPSKEQGKILNKAYLAIRSATV